MGDRDWIDEMGEQVAAARRASESDAEKAARFERERDALAARLDALGDNGPGSKRAAWVAEWQRAQLAEAERDALAAQLAALREAAGPAAQAEYASDEETRALRIALADTAPAAETYTRRVQANECERVAAIFRGNQKRCEARLPAEIVDVADVRREALAEAWCAAASECEARAAEIRGGR